MYQYVQVLENVDSETIRIFHCFLNMKTQQYAVQSLDYFYLDSKTHAQMLLSNKQLTELFAEQDPIERSGGYKTIEEAIDSFIESWNK